MSKMISESSELSAAGEQPSSPCTFVPLPHLDSSSPVSTATESEGKRATWSRHLDFFFSCVGYAVGLGNIWRFPYLCYQSGGGAFLIPYFFFLVVCGIPLFFLEMGLGQFGSRGPIAIWKVSPIFRGLGYGMALVSAVVCIYYNVIIAWVLYYIYESYSVSWSSCKNSWNTADCVSHDPEHVASNTSFTAIENEVSFYDNLTSPATPIALAKRTSSEEFWLFHVLRQSEGIADVGEFQPPLVLALFLAWVIVCLCVLKGIKSAGKVVYVTATLPYVVLIIFLIRGLLLPGAWEGVSFYLQPQWDKLLTFKVWGAAATQIFYSVGAGWGALLTMASYNKFSNNVYRDSMVVPLINCGTSLLAGLTVFSVIGFMAHETGRKIEDVVSQGAGLAFIVYPEAISRLPGSSVWAFLFFIMLLAVGLDTQFAMFETALSACMDVFPNFLKKRKIAFTIFLSCVMFILGLPCVTQGGSYVVELMDYYSAAFSLMVISLLETIAVAWIYGVDRFMQDICLMTRKVPGVWWKLCWLFITPATIIALLGFIVKNHTTATHDFYVYPAWSIGLGWIIAACSIVPIPVVAVLKLVNSKGNLKQRLIACARPTSDWGPLLEENAIEYRKSLSIVPSNFEQTHILSPSEDMEKIPGADFESEVIALQEETNL